MKTELYNHLSCVASFDMTVTPTAIVIRNVEIHDRKKLPIPLRGIPTDEMDRGLRAWLMGRVIPANRINIDTIIYHSYGMKGTSGGRLGDYAVILSVLCYMRSGMDAYYISPVRPEVITAAMEYMEFQSMWFWKPYRFSSVNESDSQSLDNLIMDRREKDGNIGMIYNSLSSGIPSKYPSVFTSDGKLIQNIDYYETGDMSAAQEFIKNADECGCKGIRSIQGKYLITDFGDTLDDTVFLGDVINTDGQMYKIFNENMADRVRDALKFFENNPYGVGIDGDELIAIA